MTAMVIGAICRFEHADISNNNYYSISFSSFTVNSIPLLMSCCVTHRDSRIIHMFFLMIQDN